MPLPQTETNYTAEDFYNMPDDVRAELINGKLYYMASPSRIHQKILGELHFMILRYIKSKNGTCEVYPAPFSVQLQGENDTVLEPDISVVCAPSKLNDRGCIGAPDWIIEIVSPSSVKHDYFVKLNLYINAGVREYWIVNPQDRNVTVYSLEQDMFHVKTYSFHDKIKAGIYDDLFIDFSEVNYNI